MEYLLLTQSGPDGKNQMILKDIGTIINTFDRCGNVIYKNFDDLSEFGYGNEIKNADTIVMVVPEWNGSIPYMLKQSIDQSGWPSFYKEKEIVLIGTCGGMESTFEGISHLRHILKYVGANVMPGDVFFNGLSKDLPKEHYRSETNYLTQLIKEICLTHIND
jgi:chromate reductase, NAD(P)H dehydrogenase (quinone)